MLASPGPACHITLLATAGRRGTGSAFVTIVAQYAYAVCYFCLNRALEERGERSRQGCLLALREESRPPACPVQIQSST